MQIKIDSFKGYDPPTPISRFIKRYNKKGGGRLPGVGGGGGKELIRTSFYWQFKNTVSLLSDKHKQAIQSLF